MPRSPLLALPLVACLALPAAAAEVGQPFLVADSDLTGSILDFFGDYGPTGVDQVSLSGTITSAIGSPTLAGQPLSFATDQGNGTATLTVGGTTIDEFAIFSSMTGSYDFDPFQEGPGDLNFALFIEPPFTEPEEGTFDYHGAFEDYPTRMAEFPGFEVVLSVYLDGPLPTKLFEATDDEGNVIETFTYVEGPLPVARITLGTVGGAALPAEVPLPAGLPLLGAGLAGLALLRRRSSKR